MTNSHTHSSVLMHWLVGLQTVSIKINFVGVYFPLSATKKTNKQKKTLLAKVLCDIC